MTVQTPARLILATALLLPIATQAQESAEKPKELELLKRYVGNWKAEITRRYVDASAEDQRFQSSMKSEPVLGGWFVKGVKNSFYVESPEGTTKELVLATYDSEIERYVSWSFQSTGRITNWSGIWDPEIEVLHWYSRTEPPAKPIEAKTKFVDENSIQSECSNQTGTGKLFFEKTIRTRKRGAVIDLTDQLWSKIETPIKPIPKEVKKLQPLVGQWDAEYTQLPSNAFPRGSETNGRITGKWILDGRFFLGRSKVQNYETMWVIGYDTDKKTYRYIRFDNRGEIEENVGEWNGDTRTFKWKVVNGKPGHSKRATVYIIGDETVQSRITSRDPDGDLLLDLRIRAKRKK